MSALAVNARFRLLEPGGYRTYAEQIVGRLDQALVVEPGARWAQGGAGRLWEQTVLRHRARGRVLLNPCNSGPLFRGRQINVIHDLAPLDRPELFSPRYVRLTSNALGAFARSADIVVTPSRSVADGVISQFGIGNDDVVVIPPGLPRQPDPADRSHTPILETLDIDQHRPLVVGLSSGIPRKNGRTVVGVLHQVKQRRPDSQVVTIGWDGPSRVFGDEQRPSHSMVTDLGEVSDQVLAALYGRADVVLALPYVEGFGMAQVEALHAGATLVSSPVPSILEHCPQSCRLVDPDDSEAAIEAVLAALESPSGQRQAPPMPDLDWDRGATRFIELAESLQ